MVERMRGVINKISQYKKRALYIFSIIDAVHLQVTLEVTKGTKHESVNVLKFKKYLFFVKQLNSL